MSNKRVYEELINQIIDRDNIVIILHISPDGDTLGAGLALWKAISQYGKHVAVVCQDKIPATYRFLEYSEKVLKPDEIEWIPELAIAVDVADKSRMGEAYQLYSKASHTVCIDHHASNSESFALLDYIAPEKGATCILVYELIREMGVDIDYNIAESLYVGFSTDTGNFNYSSTSPEIFRATADLLERHALDIVGLTRRLYRCKSRQRLKLTARALDSLRFERDGKISIMSVTQKDFSECGAEHSDIEGLINMAIDCEGVVAALLACEDSSGVTKISFRSLEPVDVGVIAASMGGGGHARASGCTLNMPMDEALKYAVENISANII